jgi:hypothetical protein
MVTLSMNKDPSVCSGLGAQHVAGSYSISLPKSGPTPDWQYFIYKASKDRQAAPRSCGEGAMGFIDTY